MLYAPSDSAAIEVEWPGYRSVALNDLVDDCLRLGFRRIAIVPSEGSLRAGRIGLSSVLAAPRTLLVVREVAALLGLPRRLRHRVLLRTRPDSSELEAAYRAGVRPLVELAPSDVVHFLGSLGAEPAGGSPREVVLDLSSSPAELSGVLGGYTSVKVRVWDDLLDAALLRAHPCYAYRTTGEGCHLGRRALPRRITVNRAGDLMPYGLPREFSFGTVGVGASVGSVLARAHASRQLGEFQEAAQLAVQAFVLAGGGQLLSWDAVLTATSGSRQC